MIVIDYTKKQHKKIIHACVLALKQGNVVAYPTDTSYGLAADATNIKALKKLYKIKERDFNKPVHIVVPSIPYAKKLVAWNPDAQKLSKKFLPGPLTLVLPIKTKNKNFTKLAAKTGYLGLRIPKNQIAIDLAAQLKHPITATSANPSAHLSGGYDSYSAEDVLLQFKNKKYKPDIVINAGKLPKRKPSTLVKITSSRSSLKSRVGVSLEILRKGPISMQQIRKALL